MIIFLLRYQSALSEVLDLDNVLAIKCLLETNHRLFTLLKKRYYLTFLYCLQEKFLQCQKDMFKCIVAGNKTKLECLRESKGCLAELLPSQPPQFLVSADHEVPMQEIHKLRKIIFLLSS